MSADDFEELGRKLGLGMTDFDIMLVGDGSGTTVDKACGWYCGAYMRPYTYAFRGGASNGTNNFAELMPYVHALWTLHSMLNRWTYGKQHYKVTIVSDSEVTVRIGNGQYQATKNESLWAAMNWFKDNGYEITWIHVPRNSNPISTLADAEAKKARVQCSNA
jgi:ribonuclease HI